MSTQELETMERAAEKKAKTEKKLPCIYDPEIRNPCLVRDAIVNIKAPMTESMAKYTLPKEMAGFTAGIESIFSTMGEALHSELSVLSAYCEHCPFLSIFKEKLDWDIWQVHNQEIERRQKLRRERRKRRT